VTQAESLDTRSSSEPAQVEERTGIVNWPWLVPVLLGLLGVVLLLYYTRFGAWVSGDAVHYIAGARSLMAGDIYGYPAADGVRPIVAFPPLLSTVLAGIGLFGIDPLPGSRYLNSVLFGVNIALTWLITFRFSGSKVTAALIAAWFLLSQIIVAVHGAAMSEALFILLTLVSIYALGRFVIEDDLAWLVFGGIAAGLSIITRFAGLALVAASVAALILFWDRGLREKLRAAALYVVPALLPFAYWSFRNSGLSDTATGRPVEWLLTRTRLALSLGEASTWLFGDVGTRRVQILLMAALVALAFAVAAYLTLRIYRDRRLTEGARWFPTFLLTFILGYLAMMIASMAFLDATLRITQRYLSPVLAVAMILTGILAGWRLARPGTPIGLGRVITGAFVALLALNGWKTIQIAIEPPPRGYADVRDSSGTIVRLLEIDPEVTIITNAREYVYIRTGRSAYSVPLGRDQFTQALREDLPGQMAAYRDRLADGAVLALFDDYWVRGSTPSGGTLIEGLEIYADAEDGTLYVDPNAWRDSQGGDDASIYSRG